MNVSRHYSRLDQALISCQRLLDTLLVRHPPSSRPFPSEAVVTELSPEQQRQVAGLMRINHTGEVCAQALYQGQALTARLPTIRAQMEQAAVEERDHLSWCEQRLSELASQPSKLNIVWYAGSFCIGALAGAIGDKWSLGFLAETERQVTQHLESHLKKLPIADLRTQDILLQMKQDEMMHAETAHTAGAAILPGVIRIAMKLTSKIMTSIAYWI